jgi:hypothetical protein
VASARFVVIQPRPHTPFIISMGISELDQDQAEQRRDGAIPNGRFVCWRADQTLCALVDQGLCPHPGRINAVTGSRVYFC